MAYFTDAQKKFRSEVRDFVLKEFAPEAATRSKLDYIEPEVINKLACSGFFKLTIPRKYGGDPKDAVSIGIVIEEMCKVDSSPMILLISEVVIPLLMEWASVELKEEWLPYLAKGEKIPCFANTEPDCGSDAGAIKTRAVRDGDSYIINGEKTSVSVGMQADVLAMTAKTDPGAGIRGVTLFLVPLDLPGVTKERFFDMGAIPSGRASVSLSDVHLSIKFRIGDEGDGFGKVMRGFDFTRVLAALAAVGMAESCISEAVEYVKERKAFGHSISKFEGVSFKLAEDATLLEASRLLCYEALRLRDEGLPHAKEAAMAKWFSPKCAVQIIHDILLIFGWRGYSETKPIEQRLRDAIGLQIGDGTAEIMKLIIAREMLGGQFGPTI